MGNGLNLHDVTKVVDRGWVNEKTKEGNKHYKTRDIEVTTEGGEIFYITLFTKHCKKVNNVIQVDNKIIEDSEIENIYEE